jgi:DNA processing protein
MDNITKLGFAIAATRRGPVTKLSVQAQRSGLGVFAEAFDHLHPDERCDARREAEELSSRGVLALLRGTNEYPALLDLIRNAPPALFCQGNISLLSGPGIGVCGSRNASDEGLRASIACGQAAASQGIVSISGYARGVDMATHTSTLEAGGHTIIVLPEGIDNYRVKRGDFERVWDPDRALVVSQFSPTQPWSTGAAMARNTVIIGLGLALVVVEAGEKGGTFAAGKRALELNRRVIALEFTKTPRGNSILLDRGAVAVRNKLELSSSLNELRYVNEGPRRCNADRDAQAALM